jgi:hypothetical protein
MAVIEGEAAIIRGVLFGNDVEQVGISIPVKVAGFDGYTLLGEHITPQDEM